MTIINLNAMGNNSEKLKKNTIKISPEFASNLIFGKIEEVNDDLVGNSDGDGDGIVDAGETIEFRISLENIGSNDATSVNATISCLDTQINIIKSNQTFLTIFANQSGISSSYYIFSINSSINCSTKIPFLLNISSLEGNWNDIFEIEIIGTINLSYYMYSVQSESNGDLIADNDRIIDAGEIIDFNVYVKNLGEAKGSNVMGKISTSDIYVSIIGDICLFGSIAPENHGFGNFKIRISGSIPDKHTVWFLLNLTDDFNSEWNLYFKVIINGIPNFEIIDVNFFESYGNGDKELDAGEFWYPFITLNNTGSAISSSTFIIFSSSSPYVLFFSDISNRNMSIGSVCAGQTINQTFLSNNYYYWAFKISSKIPKDYLIPFSCLIFNQNFQISWNISFTKKSIGIANYEIINISFKELSGNSDAIMDPSETWVPIINIRNIGKGAGFSVSVFFNISDLFISFSHTANFRNRSLGNLLSGENKTLNGQDINLMSSYYWAFTILDNIPINYSLEYQIFISDESEEIKMTEKGTLIINSHGSNVNSSDLDIISSFLAILVVLICGIGVVSCYNSSQKDDEEKKNIQSDYLPELARITPSTLKLQINEIPPLYQPHDEKTETFFDDSNDFNLDDYEILHNIAQGGMGEILLIREKNLGQLFAMKHLFVESYNGVENCKKYWIQEQKILQIQSKSPVRALQYKSAFKLNNRSNSTDFYILTEYLQGITLEEWIKKKPEILSNYEIAYRLRNIILPLTIHLNFIHSQGIIHRDITPRNIMIITDNSKIIPVLIDWGVAKIDQNDRIERPASNTKATTIVSMGNPPEILAGLEPVIASDIYMLGNIMYYILSAGEIIIPYRESDYPLDISKINSTLPFDLIQLIKDMTHFSSSNRIQPTMKIIHTIEQILLHFESSE